MDWREIKATRFELEKRGYFIESFNEKCFIISNLKDNDSKLYYVYPNVRENGMLKIFDFNIKEDK